jgi:hypothetical protein
MSLLLRCVLVVEQPAVDHRRERVDGRADSRRVALAWWRHRRSQRLPHHASVDTVLFRELADRQLLASPVPSDLLEQFHPRPHLTDLPADIRTGRSEPGWGQHS